MALRLIIFFVLFTSLAWAGQQHSSYIGTQDKCLTVQTEDGTVKNLRCKDLKVSDGFLESVGSGSDAYFLLRAGLANGGATSMTTNETVVSTSYNYVYKSIASDPAFNAGTLANGKKGQVITIHITEVESGGTWTLTPATRTGFDTLVFEMVDDFITLLYLDDTSGWVVIGGSGSVGMTH